MTGSIVHPTSIDGLLRLDLQVHRDERGWFKEGFQQAKFEADGFPPFEVVQSNVAFSDSIGVTRGIHAEPWDKCVSLAQGRAFAAIVDLRDGPGFGTVETFDLDESTALFVPRGCGNSYQTLTPGVVYTYLVNAHWSPGAEYTMIDAYDPELAIPWPIDTRDAIRSTKDSALPRLADIATTRVRQ